MLQADPYQLRFLASRFAAAADEIRRKAGRMEEITHSTTGGSSAWKGQAANQFTQRNEFLATELRDSVKQFDLIINALQTLASRVEMIQAKEQRLHQLQQERSQLSWGLDVSKDTEIAAINSQIYMLEAEITADQLFADSAAAAAFQSVKFQESFHEVWLQVQQTSTTAVEKMEGVEQDLINAAEKKWAETPEPVKEAVENIAQFAEGFGATYLENEAMGLADPLHEDFPEERSKVYQAGRVVGDITASVQGIEEIFRGSEVEAAGDIEAVVTSETGVLPLLGIAAAVEGTTLVGHGWNSLKGASLDLGKDWTLFKKDAPTRGSSTPETKSTTSTTEKVEYGDHYTTEGRKKVLTPNVEYTDPRGYTYKTDSKGRIISAEGKLELGNGKRNTHAQSKTNKAGEPGDEGGHLIATIFEGSGNIDNLVPMDGNLNKGEWKKLENLWKKALEEGSTVEVKIRPIYKGDSKRPDMFNITYKLNNGRKTDVKLQNSPGGI